MQIPGNPTDTITVPRALVADCLAVIDAAHHPQATGGQIARVIIALQYHLEHAAAPEVVEAPETRQAGDHDAGK